MLCTTPIVASRDTPNKLLSHNAHRHPQLRSQIIAVFESAKTILPQSSMLVKHSQVVNHWWKRTPHCLVILSWWWIWARSWRCGSLVAWFCYQLIAKPGNKTFVTWPIYFSCSIWYWTIPVWLSQGRWGSVLFLGHLKDSHSCFNTMPRHFS